MNKPNRRVRRFMKRRGKGRGRRQACWSVSPKFARLMKWTACSSEVVRKGKDALLEIVRQEKEKDEDKILEDRRDRL